MTERFYADGYAHRPGPDSQLLIGRDSQTDPTNAVDDVDSYALLNLYLGPRDRGGAWEVALYGKNLTDTERVLRRDSSPATVDYKIGATSVTGVSTYRRIALNEPREFGVNVRYAFGSR